MVQTYHYPIISRAIEHITSSINEQPKLEEIANYVGMSPYHFQRLFSEWVGISPKAYQQYLTLGFSKELLRKRHSVLDASLMSGLSGGSRLHDLFIKWEAMTPGEYVKKGEGLIIRWSWFNSPFGKLLALATDRGLCGLGFSGVNDEEEVLQDYKNRWPNAVYIEDKSKLEGSINSLISNEGSVNIHLLGAPFQIKVWEALLNIPSAYVTTYSDVANAINNKNAVRAVGTAIGNNPIGWLIPCHRVLRKNGDLGGYHWGLDRKIALIARESAQFESINCTELD